MFRACLVVLALIPVAGVGSDPPGKIVIRPRGHAEPAPPARVGPVAIPDRPGFIVIRPRGWPTPSPTGTGTLLPAQQPATAPTATRTLLVQAPAAAPRPAPDAPADEGTLRSETWDVLFARGVKAGYFHTVVREFERDGQKLLYGVKRAKLRVARFGQPSEQWTEEATVETLAGEVLSTRMTQGIGKDQRLSLEGRAVEGELRVSITGDATVEEAIPFPPGVVGVAGNATLYAARKPKVGDTFQYKSYLASINRVVTHTVTVKTLEQLTIYEGQAARPVLRCEETTEKLDGYRHPAATVWVDAATLEPVRLDSKIPLLGGAVTVLRTSKDYATQPVANPPELNEVQSIVLDRPVPDMHTKTSVTYRVTLEDADLPHDETFTADSRQQLTRRDATSFDLTVTARRSPTVGAETSAEPGAEYLGTSFFIDWDTPQVRQHAAQAIAGLPAGASTWQKAQAIEAWVNRNMKAAEFSQAMASCSKTATTLSGDCTEYAMLATGLCRSVGVPARTALGLVYAPARDGRGTLAYHMWFEVFIGGEWLPLDATLGRGSVGPGHLKITSASWDQEKSFAPLLPVLAVTQSSPRIQISSLR